MGKVLMLAHHFPPFVGGGVIRIIKFCKYLPSFGWEPTVITIGQQKALKPDKSLLEELDLSKVSIIHTKPYLTPVVLRYADKLRKKKLSTGHIVMGKNEEIVNDRRNLVRDLTKTAIGWLRKILYGYILIPDKGILWKRNVIPYIKKLRKKHEVDLIFSTAPPNSSHLIAMRAKKILNIPWVVDFRDAWVGNPFSMPSAITTSFKIARERKLEREVCEKADIVISATEPATEGLKSRYPSIKDKFITLPNGYDPADFSPSPRQSFSSDRLMIKYIGSIGGSRNPEKFFEVLRKIKTSDIYDNIEIEFIGSFSYNRQYWEKELSILKFRDTVPHNEAIQIMNDAHVLLLFQLFDSGSMYAVPGKMYEYIASGRPIWGLLDTGPARDLIEKEKLGYLSYPEDVESIQSALEQIHKDWRENRLRTIFRKKLLEEYNRKNLTYKLSELLNRLNKPL